MPRAPELSPPNRIKVVVLVLENNQGDILLTQRKSHQHLAGYWEFPGGKIEAGESATTALQRECKEELNYHVSAARQILNIHHDYPTMSVELLVYHEISINPKVTAAENQPMKWVMKADLIHCKLPEANLPILHYLQANAEQT